MVDLDYIAVILRKFLAIGGWGFVFVIMGVYGWFLALFDRWLDSGIDLTRVVIGLSVGSALPLLEQGVNVILVRFRSGIILLAILYAWQALTGLGGRRAIRTDSPKQSQGV